MSTKSFSELKRNRAALTEKLTQEFAQADKKGNAKDPRYWQVTRDKSGNGYAVIRFLPNELGKPNWVQHLSYAVQGPGGWYIENSRKMLGKDEADPMSEYNSELWNSGLEKDKDIARKQKMKKKYIVNILVINDPEHPENNGKVFLYNCGKKVLDKCNDMLDPKYPDEPKVNVFDMWEGANFKLKVRNGDGGFPNYEKSEFEAPSAISDDDAKIESIWDQRHDIMAEISADKIKSYDELKARFDRVFNRKTNAQTSISALPETAAPSQKASQSAPFDTDDDDELAEFRRLANED
jgi:hypothetical protein